MTSGSLGSTDLNRLKTTFKNDVHSYKQYGTDIEDDPNKTIASFTKLKSPT